MQILLNPDFLIVHQIATQRTWTSVSIFKWLMDWWRVFHTILIIAISLGSISSVPDFYSSFYNFLHHARKFSQMLDFTLFYLANWKSTNSTTFEFRQFWTLSNAVKTWHHFYQGEFKVLQYFGNFLLWRWQTKLDGEYAELVWYSQHATSNICLLKHSLRIHSFRSTWHCLIINGHATWEKFLTKSSYCTIINFAFIFCHTTNVPGCFHNITAQFEIIKHKFSN